jgi:hypothetical protein
MRIWEQLFSISGSGIKKFTIFAAVKIYTWTREYIH